MKDKFPLTLNLIFPALGVLILSAVNSPAAKPGALPNIVIIFTDD